MAFFTNTNIGIRRDSEGGLTSRIRRNFIVRQNYCLFIFTTIIKTSSHHFIWSHTLYCKQTTSYVKKFEKNHILILKEFRTFLKGIL